MIRPRPLLILPLVLLAGCKTVGPDYVPPAPTIAEGWVEPALAGEVEQRWWATFGDAQLEALVERALTSAPDVREARARLEEARAGRDAVRGGQAPQVRATASATETVLSENGQIPIGNFPGFEREFTLFDSGFDASWEIDLWGRNARQSEAAEARVEAAEWGRREVMVAIAAEVARNYVDLRQLQAERAALAQQQEAQGALARLTRLRFDAGEATRGEADAAAAAAAALGAQAATLEALASAAAYRIAALLGVPPEEVVPALRQPAAIPVPPDAIASGIRSELLQRRPDVARSERELAAATADIGVATAELYPRISLLGSVGTQARSPDDLLSTDSLRLGIGPSFSWPIFSGGRVRAQIWASDARAEAAAARFDKAVAGALADSEAAANRFAAASRAARSAAVALQLTEQAVRLSELRVERGEEDRLALSRAQLQLAEARRQQAQAAAARAAAAVALYKALGGGWDVPETTDSGPVRP